MNRPPRNDERGDDDQEEGEADASEDGVGSPGQPIHDVSHIPCKDHPFQPHA